MHYDTCATYLRGDTQYRNPPLPACAKVRLCGACKPALGDVKDHAGRLTWLQPRRADAMTYVDRHVAVDTAEDDRRSYELSMGHGKVRGGSHD